MLAIPILLYVSGSLLLNGPRDEQKAEIIFDSDPDTPVSLPWIDFRGFSQAAVVTGSILLPPITRATTEPQALYFTSYEGILRIFSHGDLLVEAGSGSVIQGPSHLQDLLVWLPGDGNMVNLTFSIESAGTQFLRLQGGYVGPVSNFEKASARHNFYYNDLRNIFIGIEIFIALIMGALVASQSAPAYYRHLVVIVLFFVAIQASSFNGDLFSINRFYHHFMLLLPYAACLSIRLIVRAGNVTQKIIKTACHILLFFAAVLAALIQLDLLPATQITLFYSLPLSLTIWVIGAAWLLVNPKLLFDTYLTAALLITTISVFFGIAHDFSVKFGWIDSDLLFIPLCIPIFFGSIALALVLDFVQARRDLEALNHDLQKKVTETGAQIQREYSKRVIVEVERAKTQAHKSLMMDLHDGALGYLASIYALLEPRTDEKTTTAKELAKSAMNEIRLMLNRDTSNQQGSLLLVLAVFRDQMRAKFRSMGVKLDMDVSSLAEYESPSDKFNLNIYRILQEATTNAVDRAACTDLRIFSYIDQRDSFLCIENSGGQGLSMASGHRTLQGSGIANMKARAQTLGAELSVTPQPTGARVLIKLPPAPNP